MLPDGGAELEKTCKISLDYDCVENIELKRKSLPYLKWDGPSSIAEVEPRLSTFECITFVMKNGNTFALVHPHASASALIPVPVSPFSA